MKIALISDTHGNFTALSAVLADMESSKVDKVIFLGDAVTIGSQPNEILKALQELDSLCIMGNHDEAVLFPDQAERLQIAMQLHSSVHWCIQHMSLAEMDFIRSFQSTLQIQVSPATSLLCYHGSPLSNTDSILANTESETIDGYFSGCVSSILAGGHTHVQMMRRHGNKLLINPGSVGNAFQYAYRAGGGTPALLPWAEYAILRVDGETVSVDLRRVPFDTQEVLRLMSESGNPSAQWWLDQYNR